MSTPTREHDHGPSEARARFEPGASATRRRMLLIVNPHAASVSERMRDLIVNALEGRFRVEAIDTEAQGHATELCREAAHEGYDVVVALGGDGTVNEAANGMLGSPTPLSCLPGGSANVFGKLLGVPGELIDATEHLLAIADDWRPRKVDLGVVNGRCFTFSSGLGLDASVVERVDSRPDLKARLGPYFFAWTAVTTLVRRYLLRPSRMEVRAGHSRLEGVTAIIQNGSSFTYFQDRPIEIAEGASLDSGELAGAVLHRATPLGMSLLGLRAFLPRARVVRHRQVSGFAPVEELTVRSADGRALPLQADGDYLGDVAEARYSIMPAVLNIVA
jgi:diacylglycerol kinase family enzyme